MTNIAFNAMYKVIAFPIAIPDSGISRVGECTEHSAPNVQSVAVPTMIAGACPNFRVVLWVLYGRWSLNVPRVEG